jgi:hypothetical protein
VILKMRKKIVAIGVIAVLLITGLSSTLTVGRKSETSSLNPVIIASIPVITSSGEEYTYRVKLDYDDEEFIDTFIDNAIAKIRNDYNEIEINEENSALYGIYSNLNKYYSSIGNGNNLEHTEAIEASVKYYLEDVICLIDLLELNENFKGPNGEKLEIDYQAIVDALTQNTFDTTGIFGNREVTWLGAICSAGLGESRTFPHISNLFCLSGLKIIFPIYSKYDWGATIIYNPLAKFKGLGQPHSTRTFCFAGLYLSLGVRGPRNTIVGLSITIGGFIRNVLRI